MKKFSQLHKQLTDARSQLELLGDVSPVPVTHADYLPWKQAHAAAKQAERAALFGMECLTAESATVDELAQALEITGSRGDLAWHLEGAKALDSSPWFAGQHVRIQAPTRMGDTDGAPMVAYRDAWTDKAGKVAWMTPDGMDLHVRFSDGSCVDVYRGRVTGI